MFPPDIIRNLLLKVLNSIKTKKPLNFLPERAIFLRGAIETGGGVNAYIVYTHPDMSYGTKTVKIIQRRQISEKSVKIQK